MIHVAKRLGLDKVRRPGARVFENACALARKALAGRNVATTRELFLDAIFVGGAGEQSDAVHFNISGGVCRCTAPV